MGSKDVVIENIQVKASWDAATRTYYIPKAAVGTVDEIIVTGGHIPDGVIGAGVSTELAPAGLEERQITVKTRRYSD